MFWSRSLLSIRFATQHLNGCNHADNALAVRMEATHETRAKSRLDWSFLIGGFVSSHRVDFSVSESGLLTGNTLGEPLRVFFAWEYFFKKVPWQTRPVCFLLLLPSSSDALLGRSTPTYTTSNFKADWKRKGTSVKLGIWTVLESGIIIVAACLPSLWPLISKLIPRRFLTNSSSNQQQKPASGYNVTPRHTKRGSGFSRLGEGSHAAQWPLNGDSCHGLRFDGSTDEVPLKVITS